MRINLRLLFVAFVFILAFFLRTYKLGEIPNGLQQDETSIGFNAYSILQSGHDEYGEYYPLYFKAFGEYKLPLYIYATVPSIAIFGVNEWGVRFPAALFGSLTVVLFYFLVTEISDRKDKYLPLIAAIMLAINPWHLHFSRGAFEVSLALFFIVGGLYFFLKGARSKSYSLLILSAFLFVGSVYTYNIARLFTPIFILMLLVLFRNSFSFRSRFIYASFVLPLGLLILPFLYSFLSAGGLPSTSGTLIFSSNAVKAQLLEFRSYFFYYPAIYASLFFNTYVLTFLFYLKNIVSYFSVDFYFISGSSHGNHGVGNVGMFYLYEFSSVVLGSYLLILKKGKYSLMVFLWFVLVILIASITREAPHATRGFFLIPVIIFVSSVGLYEGFELMISSGKYKKTLLCLFVLFSVYNVFYYFNSYYVRFPVFYADKWKAKDKELVEYIEIVKGSYSKILIDDRTGFVYTSYLFYSKFDPELFYSSSQRMPDDNEGFSKVNSFSNIEIREVDWSKDLNQPNILIITNHANKPNEVGVVKEINYPLRPVVASIKEELMQFPVIDNAYVLLKTK